MSIPRARRYPMRPMVKPQTITVNDALIRSAAEIAGAIKAAGQQDPPSVTWWQRLIRGDCIE